MENVISKNRIAKTIGMAVMLTALFSSCKKKEDTVEPMPDPVVTPTGAMTISYPLNVKDQIGVTGTVTFAEKSSGSSESVITIKLTGASVGTHPAHIHVNSAIESGSIAYPLNSVDSSGTSTTTLSVPYATLVNYDGYVNVHASILDIGTIIAQGDIGGNVLTGDFKTYALAEDSASGISGSALFQKRKNGNTLVTIDLTSGGLLPAGNYPAHINLGSVSTIGMPYNKKTLNAVNSATRKSMTNIKTLDDGTAIKFDNWTVYDGFITIHDANDNDNVIAKGNIGAN
jgi:uncharacterized lipoprotein YbaY